MKDSPEWKNVTFLVITGLAQDFGGDEAGGATVIHACLLPAFESQSEVDDDWVSDAAVPEHDVLQFDVSVHDIVLVQFLNPLSQPTQQGLAITILWETPLKQVLVKVYREVFHDHVDGSFWGADGLCLAEHWVFQQFQGTDFAQKWCLNRRSATL